MANEATVGMVLHDVARMMRRDFDRRARALGLTRSRWQVLWHLSRHEGIHQAALAELLDVAPISLARQVDRLEQEGLVERRADPEDRRRCCLFLTDAATPALEALRANAAETRKRALQGLDNEAVAALKQGLETMRTNLSDYPQEDSE